MTDNRNQVRPFSGSDARLLPPGQKQRGGMVAGRGEIYYPDAEQRAIVRMDQPQVRRMPMQGDVLPPEHQVNTPLPVQTKHRRSSAISALISSALNVSAGAGRW